MAMQMHSEEVVDSDEDGMALTEYFERQEAKALRAAVPNASFARAGQKVVLEPKDGFRAVVLLEQTGVRRTDDGLQRTFGWWALAGKGAKYEITPRRLTVRVDVPEGQELEVEYLRSQLKALWREHLPSRPPPTIPG
jgi:hypothetical protein